MILPTKHLRKDRAVLGVGAEILAQLDGPYTVSELWERVRQARTRKEASMTLTFDWFVLSLSFLYAVAAIDINDGLIVTHAR
jgi:hypothetical protein